MIFRFNFSASLTATLISFNVNGLENSFLDPIFSLLLLGILQYLNYEQNVSTLYRQLESLMFFFNVFENAGVHFIV